MTRRAGVGEAVAVWALLALQATATLVTYSRLPARELYRVQEAGDLAGGLSRVLNLLNYPHALVAAAVAAVVGGPRAAVATAIGLCAVVVVPGVIETNDLDGRLVNVIPAAGLVLALVLTVVAYRRRGGGFAPPAYGDRLRLVLGIVLLLVSLPWITAEWGFHFPGEIFYSEEIPPTRDRKLPAVHFGFHHGYGGVIVAAAALLLSRMRPGRAAAFYLSGLLAYGLGNAFQDAWNEQLWKREWVDLELPSVQRPDLTWGWLVILLGAAATYAFWFRAPAGR